ncbi:hypothetical protein AAFF_G00198950 [Aldrovandia affinis]|uniref:Uncharacterized protein n=1 Tax=Aldrovandia affinis TaxID=143900 RepID=A0AAD7W6I3_9TELE|nr:hypothetical protein AAFF_G00198950 [Aldrovandia affinis]
MRWGVGGGDSTLCVTVTRWGRGSIVSGDPGAHSPAHSDGRGAAEARAVSVHLGAYDSEPSSLARRATATSVSPTEVESASRRTSLLTAFSTRAGCARGHSSLSGIQTRSRVNR